MEDLAEGEAVVGRVVETIPPARSCIIVHQFGRPTFREVCYLVPTRGPRVELQIIQQKQVGQNCVWQVELFVGGIWIPFAKLAVDRLFYFNRVNGRPSG